MNNQSWQSTQNSQPWQSMYQPPFNTNVQYVTSIDEALAKSNTRNSDLVYFHQDQPVFYRIKVEADGRKYWQQFNYSTPDPNLTTPATKADLAGLMSRLERIEQSLFKPTEEATNNEQPNG